MKNKHLYLIWGILYALCAGLGFVTGVKGLARAALMAAALAFFVPPALLLWRDHRSATAKNARIIHRLSLAWLGSCLIMLLLNILSVAFSAQTGDVLHALLILLTAPMICGKFWAATIFLWACLLTVSWKLKKAR